MPGFARPRRTVGFHPERRRGGARVEEAAKYPALEMHHAAAPRAFMVVAIVAVAFEARIGARRQDRRAHLTPDLALVERSQKPAAPRVRRFHLERAIGLARMTDDLVRHQGVEMRIGDDRDLALG